MAPPSFCECEVPVCTEKSNPCGTRSFEWGLPRGISSPGCKGKEEPALTIEGGCHCGAVRYEIEGEANHVAVCHCTDCRRCAGAMGVAWAGFPIANLSLSGDTAVYASSPGVERRFCLICGTGLFYINADAPGQVDVQVATLDEPECLPPVRHVQMADAADWEKTFHQLPMHDRYPAQD